MCDNGDCENCIELGTLAGAYYKRFDSIQDAIAFRKAMHCRTDLPGYVALARGGSEPSLAYWCWLIVQHAEAPRCSCCGRFELDMYHCDCCDKPACSRCLGTGGAYGLETTYCEECTDG